MLPLALFALTFGMMWVGLSVRTGEAQENLEDTGKAEQIVEGAVFALLGLLLAFSLSAAWTKFDARLQTSVQEANAIGTATMRLDLLPALERTAGRRLMKQYVAERVKFNASLSQGQLPADANETARIQSDLWTLATGHASEAGRDPATLHLIPALNQMFDLATERRAHIQVSIPALIIGLIALLILTGAVLLGRALAQSKHRFWSLGLLYALCTCGALYTILDLSDPRVGLIKIVKSDLLFHELEQGLARESS